jgi:hypothetical protein
MIHISNYIFKNRDLLINSIIPKESKLNSIEINLLTYDIEHIMYKLLIHSIIGEILRIDMDSKIDMNSKIDMKSKIDMNSKINLKEKK